jgi:hypothetical protein
VAYQLPINMPANSVIQYADTATVWQGLDDWMSRNGRAGQDPTQVLEVWALPGGGGPGGDTYNRGPYRTLDHGLVHVGLLAAPLGAGPSYEDSEVETAYCHVATTGDSTGSPGTGTPLGPIAGSSVMQGQVLSSAGTCDITDPNLELRRGWYNDPTVTIAVYKKGNGPFTSRQSGGPIPALAANGRPLSFGPLNSDWPSLFGPHLHFEVRVDSRKNWPPSPEYRDFGQQDPEQWQVADAP